jgi:hypothetical protein
MELEEVLTKMGQIYRTNPEVAVRGKTFINMLHTYLKEELEGRLTKKAIGRGVTVRAEVTVFGSHKSKDVDIGVMDPDNGPLVLVGVRSQMSSIAKNALTYYESIVGECISLQDRFPMTAHGYVYLMPLKPIKVGKEEEVVDHQRYARMYAAVSDRTGRNYAQIRGVFDEFAYLVVDFGQDPPLIRNDRLSGTDAPLEIESFVDRLVSKFKKRHLFVDVFE